jgi:O-antigen/teichoic acid export membrane protein
MPLRDTVKGFFLEDDIRNKTIKGVFWSGIERFSAQGIQFILGIVMARLLEPSDYGVIGMLAVFLAISQVFVDSGFSNALIRKQDRTETDFSTVFYFNIGIGLFFYGLLFFTSPFIARFYNTPVLEDITRIAALNVLFNSLAVVQRAKLTIAVDFKNQAKATFAAVILSGTAGLVMARAGFGVRALAFQSILNTGLNTVFLWIFVRWRPLKVFSVRSFRELFSFGSKLLVSALIDTAYRNIYTIVIGKQFQAVDLGYFTRAEQLAQFPSSNITGVFQRVTFPLLSGIQREDERLKPVYRQYLRVSAFVIFPLMCGLAGVAEPFIGLVLTEKWLGVVPLLRLLSLSFMWYPVHAINLNLLQVKGRSDLFLRLEIIKKCLGVGILCITIPLGIPAMCAGTIVVSVLALIINTHYTGKIISVGFITQMRDLLPIFLTALSMGVVSYVVSNVFTNYALSLFCGITAGIIYYFLVNIIVKSKELGMALNILKFRGNLLQ